MCVCACVCMCDTYIWHTSVRLLQSVGQDEMTIATDLSKLSKEEKLQVHCPVRAIYSITLHYCMSYCSIPYCIIVYCGMLYYAVIFQYLLLILRYWPRSLLSCLNFSTNTSQRYCFIWDSPSLQAVVTLTKERNSLKRLPRSGQISNQHMHLSCSKLSQRCPEYVEVYSNVYGL